MIMSENSMFDNLNMTAISDTFTNKLNISRFGKINTTNDFSEKIPDFLNSEKEVPDFLDYEIVSNFVGTGRSSCPQSSSFSAFRSFLAFTNKKNFKPIHCFQVSFDQVFLRLSLQKNDFFLNF